MATTWDGVELWLVGLPFAPQVAVTMLVVLPLAAVAAKVLDRAVGAVSVLLGGRWTRGGQGRGDGDRPG
ncbi:MAG: hypothetical protein ABI251_02380 [Mycobacteriaceae bacterium]